MLVLMFLDRQGICLLSSQFSEMNYTYQAIHASSFQLLFLNVLFLKNTYFKKKRNKIRPKPSIRYPASSKMLLMRLARSLSLST